MNILTNMRVVALSVAAISLLTISCKRDDTTPTIPPSDGTSLTLDGGPGGSQAENMVFVDLSEENQISSKRESWDLGFYAGDQFRVILNSSKGAVTAKSSGKTNIAEVNSSSVDISQLAFGLDFGSLQVFGSFDLADDTTGILSRTAIAEIGTGDNPVYLVNTVPGTSVDANNVWKVKISRSGNGYAVQFGKLDASSVQTIDIPKNADYNFQFLSFQSGLVNVEPEKDSWDFSWGLTLYFSLYQGSPIPYGFSDFVKINHLNGVQAAEVFTSSVSYENFNESNLSGITLSSGQNSIGHSWRATTGNNAGALTDRYYIVKDTKGNIYKVCFNSMGAIPSGQTSPADGGTRGYPELEYKLVKSNN